MNELKEAKHHFLHGRLDEAEQTCQHVLERKPTSAAAIHLRGLIALQKGDLNLARSFLEQAIEREPSDPHFYNSLATFFVKTNRFDDAVKLFLKAVEIQPDYLAPYLNLVNGFVSRNRLDDAIDILRRGTEANKNDLTLRSRLASCLLRKGDIKGTLQVLEEIAKFPTENLQHPKRIGELFRIVATIQLRGGNLASAIRLYEQALQLDAKSVTSFMGLGMAFRKAGEHGKANDCYERGLMLFPNNPELRFNYGTHQLTRARFSDGWEYYESRLDLKHLWIIPKRYQDLKGTIWSSESLEGKSIFVHPEQGLGDTIMFSRYLLLLKERAGQVIFQPPKPMETLFHTQNAGISIIPAKTIADDITYDFFIPLLSLPKRFNTDFGNIPFPSGYLRVNPKRKRHYQDSYFSTSHLKVGVVWSSNPSNENYSERCLALSDFLPHVDLEQVQVYSLQYPVDQGLQKELRKAAVTDVGKDLKGFDETAAAVANLDVLVTVDTAIAHLGGAIGIPTWILVPFCPDWRWFLDRDNCPWYDSVRLFRQRNRNDWRRVLEQVRDALEKCIESRSSVRLQIVG